MKFIFWQNIISLHQAAFLGALSQKHDVTLVAEKEMAQYRVADGWEIPDMGNVKITTCPTPTEVNDILCNNADAIHVITGIDGFKMPYAAFKIATAKRLKVINMLESYEWEGVKGFLRWVKYSLLNIRYGKRINGILAMGAIGERVYRKAGFAQSKIYQWGYFTKPSGQIAEGEHPSVKPKILFVGRLDENKNSRLLVDTMRPMMEYVECLTILGDGILREEIESKTQDIPNARYLGNMPNKQVHEVMQEHDILVLPSNYDGWGAVVNEALQNGMRVIVSENCGVNVLVDGDVRGEMFYFNSKDKSLPQVLARWIAKGPVSMSERKEIMQWAKEHISGNAAAEYLESIINHIYNGAPRPTAPWEGI